MDTKNCLSIFEEPDLDRKFLSYVHIQRAFSLKSTGQGKIDIDSTKLNFICNH